MPSGKWRVCRKKADYYAKGPPHLASFLLRGASSDKHARYIECKGGKKHVHNTANPFLDIISGRVWCALFVDYTWGFVGQRSGYASAVSSFYWQVERIVTFFLYFSSCVSFVPFLEVNKWISESNSEGVRFKLNRVLVWWIKDLDNTEHVVVKRVASTY